MPGCINNRPAGLNRILDDSRQFEPLPSQLDFVLTDAAACRNATILLLDDVSTTGATLLAAASVLQTGGVGSIQAAVVARHTARK